MKIMKYFIFYLFICVPFMHGCKNKTANDAANTETYSPAFISGLETVTVELENRYHEFTLSGKVEYDPDRIITYVPLVSGVAEKVNFTLGDYVEKGRNLIGFRSMELASILSELKMLEQEVIVAHRNYESARSLFSSDMISEAELLETQAALKNIETTMEYNSRELSFYGSDETGRNFFIAAPISGYVVEKNISQGMTISPESDPVFSIADLSYVWISVNVYPGEVRFIKEGLEVDITALAYPGETFKGTISAIAHVFDAEEKVLKARIIMPNPGLKLKPEMPVLINVFYGDGQKCFAVPTEALIFDDNRYHLIVRTGDESFEIRTVTPESRAGKRTYISSGLSEGENIVVKDHLFIYTGIKEG